MVPNLQPGYRLRSASRLTRSASSPARYRPRAARQARATASTVTPSASAILTAIASEGHRLPLVHRQAVHSSPAPDTLDNWGAVMYPTPTSRHHATVGLPRFATSPSLPDLSYRPPIKVTHDISLASQATERSALDCSRNIVVLIISIIGALRAPTRPQEPR